MGFGGLGLGSMKSILQRKQGADDVSKGDLEVGQVASKPGVAKTVFPGALPFQVPATPPQSVPVVAPAIAGVQKIPASAPLVPEAPVPAPAAPPAAAPAAAGGTAAPAPGDEKKKVEKDILDLFRQEENATTPFQDMTACLPEVDITALYKDCLEMKGRLTGCPPDLSKVHSKK